MVLCRLLLGRPRRQQGRRSESFREKNVSDRLFVY